MHRVLVVEHHPQVLDALADLVAEEPGLELSGIASTADEAISAARRLQPDVVLIDVDGPSWQAKQLVHTLRELLPKALLVRLTAASDPERECPESHPNTTQTVLKTDVPDLLKNFTE
jgi:DNA-binding NarL/FixJ family response regulator